MQETEQSTGLRIAHALRWEDGMITLCGLSWTWNPNLRIVTSAQFDRDERPCKSCKRSSRS